MIISLTQKCWEDYNNWHEEDKKIFKKIQKLIKEVLRSPFSGIGKPEPLKNNLSGYWSRRITDEHRLVYKVENNQLIIISCKYHY
ncbi:Txe/YoeB family addiction module toxin [Aliarcobacter skirrowii]|jgi:toxin YoeB|uniref:Putative mRNA interferase YoeB n=1 Tax=Aliarcobacter skirrowii TaxID=28200 RepID=A0A2U2C0P7_9BACT|nr:Txe/YoeB family addiction module toxin [Aliarcobacter skirrowii]MDD2509345.1 Txe/YoeB family addiction module toxin [Aliarcobacter skirrowii]MDD3497666.1 Txe/YoeB family addiction module toxin [Aliarcobacter skirrowii]MDX4036817.1 Txe/YoeB family addiction module toxin [Aliarcobacter skirrowii]MDX4039619.1 Txe/YoeB family addiction module toxin [Aliarcobacter skirrowii]MDX4059275.1 Txe/YoeB family addiction module toxin [Aliarcobacter skirrowii]